MRTPTGSRWVSNNYITRCHSGLQSVLEFELQLQLQLESVSVAVGDRMPAEWEPAPDRGLGPSVTYGWAAQPERERSAAMVRRTLGQYMAVYPLLQLTSHTQLTSTLSNKVWEVYFYKEVCSFFHWRLHYCWLCFRLYLYMYYVNVCGNTTIRFNINYLFALSELVTSIAF